MAKVHKRRKLSVKKLLSNNSLDISRAVTLARYEASGITIDESLGGPPRKPSKKWNKALVNRLAGLS